MADSESKKIILVISLFATLIALFSILFSNPSDNPVIFPLFKTDAKHNIEYSLVHTSEADSKNAEGKKIDYKGTWKSRSESPVLNLLSKTSGLSYFHILRASNFSDFSIFLYDGIWESSELYCLEFETKSNANETNDMEEENQGFLFVSHQEIDIKQCAYLTKISYSQINGTEKSAKGELVSKDCNLDIELNVHEFEKSEESEVIVTFSLISSTLSEIAILAFIRHINDCSSDSFARKTSILMLGMHASMDLFSSIFQCNLALKSAQGFNYLILSSLISLGVFLIIQGKLSNIVWKSQYAAHFSGNMEIFNKNLKIFQKSFLVSVTLAAGFIFLFYRHIMSLLFVFQGFLIPQIVVNAMYGYKLSINHLNLFLMVISKLGMLFYFFGYANNILKSKPNYNYLFWISSYIILQYTTVLLQGTSVGPRFFIPRVLRPKLYSYYGHPEAERGIYNNECIICITPLVGHANPMIENTKELKVMMAPCHHQFHEDCLKHWMAIKMECPTCRAPLPLVEE
ncbi:unnamed protein product [Blepharisma stoltei]|uniref:RING-type E3 ubiquitin transferase n=1 Tax=Blepharisma stoltei TaxID=1481888 RepID=A0AAU9INI8_9CILI|nr:unnamed protein product [Blepharisma stoltei]